MSPIELKRRLSWLWRLSSSSISLHINDGSSGSALWIFDTVYQPDGGILCAYIEKISRLEKLRLKSFGPRKAKFGQRLQHFIKFVSKLGLLIDSDFDSKYAYQVARSIANVIAIEPPSFILVGSSKGTFASIARNLDPSAKIWEVQHGLLDASYFPLKVNRFYARSRVSAGIISEISPDVDLKLISRSLESPEGFIGNADLSQVRELVCYSKNPGGGCTINELMIFEQACFSAAKCLGLKFRLCMHPRDNLLKLILRHRGIRVLSWVVHLDRLSDISPRLMVSSYSSALITESRVMDRIINVEISDQNMILRHEYQWLPTISVPSINNLSEKTNVFIRTK